jgi:hypothetical protein
MSSGQNCTWKCAILGTLPLQHVSVASRALDSWKGLSFDACKSASYDGTGLQINVFQVEQKLGEILKSRNELIYALRIYRGVLQPDQAEG